MKKKYLALTVVSFLLLAQIVSVNAEISYLDINAYYEEMTSQLPFRALPLETQAEMYQTMKPLLEQNDKSDIKAYIPGSIPILMEHAYGLPGEADLTQSEATEAAFQFMSGQNPLERAVFDQYTLTYSFLIDTPDSPQWLVTIYDGIFVSANKLYQLLVSSRTGEIDVVFDHHHPPQDPDALLMDYVNGFPQERRDWTLEQKAMYGQKILELREAYPDFDPEKRHSIWGLPAENEIGYEQALSYAIDHIQQQEGLEKGWETHQSF